jgi:hypothetical protein
MSPKLTTIEKRRMQYIRSKTTLGTIQSINAYAVRCLEWLLRSQTDHSFIAKVDTKSQRFESVKLPVRRQTKVTSVLKTTKAKKKSLRKNQKK